MKYILSVLLALVSIHSWGAVIAEEDWEISSVGRALSNNGYVLTSDMWTSAKCYILSQGYGFDSMQTSTKFARSGSRSLRNENNTGKKHTESVCSSSERSEQKSRQSVLVGYNVDGIYDSATRSGEIRPGDEHWLGFSLYYPSNEGTNSQWWTLNNDTMNIMQTMEHKPGDWTPSVFINLRTNGLVEVESKYSTTPTTQTLRVNPKTYGNITRDRWNDFVVRHKRACDNTGILQVWLNGELITNYVNTPVSLCDKPNAYMEIGQYFGTAVDNHIRVQYIDNIKVGDETSSFAEVDPSGDDDGGGNENPDPTMVITSVNSNSPITDNQARIPMVLTSTPDHSMYECTVNSTNPRGVNFNYATGTSGIVAIGDIDIYPSSPVTMDCMYESYLKKLDVTTAAWGVANATEGTFSGDRFGYTTGLTSKKAAAGEYSWSAITVGTDVVGNNLDKMRFDFTYSPQVGSENGLYFAIVDYDENKGITAEGTAGALTAGTYSGGGFGTGVVVRNDNLGEGVYRARIKFGASKTTPQTYKLYVGSKGAANAYGASGHEVVLHEVIVRKNYTTKTATKQVALSVTDIDNPDLSGCAMPVALDPQSGTYTATLSCNTTEIGGTAYAMITATNTAPNAAAVIAKTGAIWSAEDEVTRTAISLEAGGLAYQDLWGWIVHKDAAGNNSAVASMFFDDGVGAGQAKRIKFANAATRLRTLDGSTYTGVLDYFLLTDRDPRLPGAKQDLVYIDNPTVTGGVVNFTEADTLCGTCSGSINALPLGQYWYSARSADGTVKSVYQISVVAE